MTVSNLDQQQTLESFSNAIRREMHVLSTHPSLLWQQLYNRLQWEPELQDHLEKSLKKHELPWLKDRRPHRESRELVRTLKGHADIVTNIASSPDGKMLASASQDSTIRIWNIRNGINRHILRGHKGPVLCCVYLPEGQQVLSGGDDGTLKLWNTETGTLVLELAENLGAIAWCIVDSAGKVVATSDRAGVIHIRDLKSGELLNKLSGHVGKVTTAAFSPDGRYLASGGEDKSLHLWDWKKSEEIAVFKGHRIPITSCRFSPDGRNLFSTAFSEMCIWDLEQPGEFIRIGIPRLEQDFSSCDIAPDGSFIILGTGEGLLHVLSTRVDAYPEIEEKELDPIRQEQIWSIGSGERDVHLAPRKRDLSFSGQKKFMLDLLVGRTDLTNNRMIKELFSGKFVGSLSGHSKKVNSCQVCPNGHTLISGSEDGTIKVWDIHLGRRFKELPGDNTEIKQCQYSQDGKRIYSSGAVGSLEIWQTGNGEFLDRFRRNRDIIGEFSKWKINPQGDRVVSVDDHGVLKVWDAEMRQQEINYLVIENPGAIGGDSPNYYISDLAFSPGGRRLISLHVERQPIVIGENIPLKRRLTPKYIEIALWDVESGKLIAKNRDDYPSHGPIGFHPDGKTFLVKYKNGIQICDAQTGKPLKMIAEDHKFIDSFEIDPTGKMLLALVGSYLEVYSFETGQKLYTLKDEYVHPKTSIRQAPESPSKTDTLTSNASLHWIKKIAFSPFGGLLATGTDDGWVSTWELTSGKLQWQQRGLLGEISGLAFSADGKYLISSSNKNWLQVHEAKAGKFVVSYPFLGEAVSVHCHPYLNQILAGDSTGTLYILDMIGVDGGAVLAQLYDGEKGFVLRCPACGTDYPISAKEIGKEFTCKTKSCGLKMIPKRALIRNQLPVRTEERKQVKTQGKPKLAVKRKLPSATPRPTRTRSGTASSLQKDKVVFTSYKKAAEGGSASAQMMLGTCYANGKGIPKDLKKAAELYQKAAKAGNRLAQYYLGNCYAEGFGLPKDEKQAELWYKKAAEQGSTLAKSKLRSMGIDVGAAPTTRASLSRPNVSRPSQRPISKKTTSTAGRNTSQNLIGIKAASLISKGDLKGALDLYKEQEKTLRAQKDLQALNINLSHQQAILNEMLNALNKKRHGKK